MFSIKDRPGALYNILEPFKKAKVNLTKIESDLQSGRRGNIYSLSTWKDMWKTKN